MNREMRRKGQLLTQAEVLEIITRGTSGVLSLWGKDGYPYGVPLSYVYLDGRFYFHGAAVGHKIDAIENWYKASFCIIDQDQVVAEENTTYFKSVIAFGKIRIVKEHDIIWKALKALALKYNPEQLGQSAEATIEQMKNRVCVLEFTAEQMTGKQARELVK